VAVAVFGQQINETITFADEDRVQDISRVSGATLQDG